MFQALSCAPRKSSRVEAKASAMLKFMTPIAAVGQKSASYLSKHRRDAEDLATLGLSFLAVELFVTGVPVAAVLCAAVLAALYPLPAARAVGTSVSPAFSGILRKIAIVAATAILLHYGSSASLKTLWFGPLWVAFALIVSARKPILNAIVAYAPRIMGGPIRREFIRCTLLTGSTLWLMRGFERPTLNGTDDALWYATMLADAVAQARSGIFPLWVGQSVYQFNGAIYPLRVAPAFHYLGALLDAVTFHSLGIFALQNLLMTLLALCSMASAYLCLRKLLPGREWLAAGLAALFLLCPGVLGIAYNTDLYMSWTTVPTIPLIWYATVRSFQSREKVGPMVLLGAALGLCWWGHSPIALWSTLLAFAAQVARLWFERREGIPWKPIIAGAFAFGLISAYPIGSVLLFPPEHGVRADSFQKATAGTIVYFLKQAFPGTVLPLSANGRALSDFQVGYALWATLLLSIRCQRGVRRPECMVILAAALLLAVLLLPIPWVDLGLWSVVPAFVRNTTGNWVMNRLYLPLAAAAVFGAAACVAAGLMEGPRRRRALALVVSLGCLWSFYEASKFGHGSIGGTRSKDSAVDQLRPENVQITRFSYLVFPKVPSTFTDGVADPGIENHLLARDSFAPISTNDAAALRAGHLVAEADFEGEDPAHLGSFGLGKPLKIEGGRFYLLDFDFLHPEIPGVLEITGAHFFREYGLPEFGGTRAFGAGGEHSSTLSLWTTAGTEDLAVQFIPVPALPAQEAAPQIGHARLIEYDRNALPVRVDSWIPYRARVDSPAAAWLETPRMFQVGYVAAVDGAPAAVEKSPDGFVCVAVPRGASTVALIYKAPGGLQVLFWISVLSGVGIAFAAALACFRPAVPGQIRIPTPALR
jgi:hypothetical protein